MHVKRPKSLDRDVAGELRQFVVQLGFVLSPVIAILPPRDQAADISQWSPIVPARLLELIGKDSQRQFLSEEIDGRIRDGELERFFGSHSSCQPRWKTFGRWLTRK